jgi:hypothetical protein
MKLPPTFSAGDPSCFVVASTSGKASPTVLIVSNMSASVCFVGLRFIDAQYSPSRDAIQANLRNCNETGRHVLKNASSPLARVLAEAGGLPRRVYTPTSVGRVCRLLLKSPSVFRDRTVA